MLLTFLLVALVSAAVGAISGNQFALLGAAGAMAIVVARLNSDDGRHELQSARTLMQQIVHNYWQLVFAAALLTASASAYLIAWYGDPSLPVLTLWLLSIALFLLCAYLHDRKTHFWHRLRAATQFDRYDWLAMLAMLAVAFFLRVYQLDAPLPAMHGDEGEMGTYARLALFGPGESRGELPLPYFRTAFLDHPTLFHFLQAGALALFGNTIVSLKLLSAIFGALCVPLIYALARVGWGRAAALTAAWLLAVSHLHIQYSRIALNNIETVWFTILFVLLVVLIDALGAIQRADAAPAREPLAEATNVEAQPTPPPTDRLTLFVLVGLTVGLSQYFYYGSRLLALLAIPLLLLLWRARRATLRDLVVSGLTAMAVYLPLLQFYTRNIPAFMNRTQGVSVFNSEGVRHALGPDAIWPRDWQPLLVKQLQQNVAFFVNSGDRSSFYMPEMLAFDTITVALFWLGLGVLVMQWRRFSAQSVLLWLALGLLLGGVATNDPPNAPRLIVTVPAVFVIAGAAAQQLYALLGALWPQRQRWVAGAAALAIFAGAFQMNYATYFERYAKMQPFAGRVALAQMMADHAATHRSVLLGAPNLSVNHGTLRFIGDGATRADLLAVEEFPAQRAAASQAGQGVLLIATPDHLGDLDAIRQQYPGGEFGEYYDLPGRLSFVYYQLPPP